jgi:ADP-ribose pyrophosphatase
MTMTGEETPLSNTTVYRGKILNLRVDSVRLPSGKRTIREVVEHRPAVCVVPLVNDGEVLLIRQYRYAAGEFLLEVPAGIVEENEDFLEAAQRELQEEVGFKGELSEVARLYSSPGFSTELLVLFVARNLTPSRLEADDDEFIETVRVPVSRIPEMLRHGEILDGKTFSALCWLLNTL